jgi:hypothetical protein
MNNYYEPPKAELTDREDSNTSGLGKGHPLPDGIQGWSWGAFFFNWIWAIGNKTWIGLLAFIPYVGFIMALILGVKGREWAWQNKRWENVEHFNHVQKLWSIWALVLFILGISLGIIAAMLEL